MLGACLSSFFGVLYYRIPKKLDWIKKPSFCGACGKKIPWYENIPVWAYLFLQGKCAQCGKKIPRFYFWWEVWGGLFFLYLAGLYLWQGWSWWSLACLFLFGESLIYVALIDQKKRYITNNWLLILAGITGVWLIGLLMGGDLTFWQGGQRIMMAGLWGSCFLAIDWAARQIWRVPVALGSGDAWLVMILSLWLPPEMSVTMILLAFWLGAIVGIIKLGRKKITGKGDDKLAFIPFLAGGFFFALMIGKMFWQWLGM